MKVWVLYDTEEDGEIIGITGVTTDAKTAAIWQAEFPLYKAEEFDTDNALREVLAAPELGEREETMSRCREPVGPTIEEAARKVLADLDAATARKVQDAAKKLWLGNFCEFIERADPAILFACAWTFREQRDWYMWAKFYNRGEGIGVAFGVSPPEEDGK